ncbi:MAG: DUF952 domain-containing protein [Anaerolineaceae bacterium]|nr:DUF952 domain-containing protein [Anaerolineaceae bacterium]MDD4043082.1 DUF952 domain-containing protein [Anaerolineaceae bacterium]MDD4576957.1 DUF952 domain-containing protein [Anaerolineaceae bacterium]
MIYHITTQSAWQQAQKKGEYIPEAFSADGFIHCSDHYQIENTANRFYASTPDLVVLEIEPDRLVAPLIYENLEGGEMTFPHIYGPLNLDAVVSTFEFEKTTDGNLVLPDSQQHPEPTLFSELPFGETGRVFRSPTPGSHMFDPQDEVLEIYLANNVNTVVVLNPEEEHLRFSGKNLLDRYKQAGLRVIYDPVPDFSAPPVGHWDQSLQEAVSAVRNGENLAVHCHAGVGRTGIFTALMAHELLGTDADESIAWVRKYIPYAIDTDYQKRFVREQIERMDSEQK